MAIRNVFVHPGDLLAVHIVSDKDEKPTKATFEAQGYHSRNKLLLTIHGANEVGYSEFSYRFRLDSFDGAIKRWLS